MDSSTSYLALKTESAHISMEAGQSSTDVALTTVSHQHQNDWIFDTAASSHMTPHLGKYQRVLEM